MKLFLILLLGAVLPCNAQFVEKFDDSDFINNPLWTGNLESWKINENHQLQSDHNFENSTFFLSTQSNQIYGQWDFNIQLDFATSGSNYVDVYIISLDESPLSATNKGYFVRIGNTDDEICLYRKDGNSIEKIIDGVNSSVGGSSCNVNIRVIRDSTNRFFLFRDLEGSGSFICEGIKNDSTLNVSNFFSLVVKQSTSTFFYKHFFDDIIVQPLLEDSLPPYIVDLNLLSPTTLKIIFNEPLDKNIAEDVSNYLIEDLLIHPLSATLDSLNSAQILLRFSDSFPQRERLVLKVRNIQDLWFNTLSEADFNFNYILPKRFDILINEIMADPSPPLGLPEIEWIEIKNNSGFDINLENWKLCLNNSESGFLPFYNLKADSLLIICASINKALLSNYGNVLGINTFPSLPNEAALIFLKSSSSKIIHAVSYSDKWYKNPVKKIGGYSLEMIDPNNPCSENNWSASDNIIGATPGKINSINKINIDEKLPAIRRVYTIDSTSVLLYFSESIDSTQASIPTNFKIENINIESANVISPLFNAVKLNFAQPLQRNFIYKIKCINIFDCAGNIIDNSESKFGLHEQANSDDLVINEILFNPSLTGVDFVELYNRGKKLLDLKNIFIANKTSSGDINLPIQLSTDGQTLFPGDFIVLSRDQEIVKKEYINLNTDAFLDISMPAFNDDKGSVVILNSSGEILDELNYTEKWHFPLISNAEGVSLERLHYKGFSDNKEYWTSASKSSGYATPSYKNSQYLNEEPIGEVSVNPKVISPDNDGFYDLAMIDYVFKKPGMLCTIIIFDASGRAVRYLQRNVLAGIKGSFKWDGLGENFRKLQSGIYIIYTEALALDGTFQKFKNTIVVSNN